MKTMRSQVRYAGLFEDVLNNGHELRVKVTGVSMRPFLNSGETVTVRKAPASFLSRGDLVLFRDSGGNLLLHRILRRKKMGTVFVYQTKGDAAIGLDEPVFQERILGRVCKIEKNHRGLFGSINLDSVFWRKFNYLAAIAGLIQAGAYKLARTVL